jgi:hypothetical protein
VRWYTGPVSATLVFTEGLWRCHADRDGHRYYGTGRSISDALRSLELQLLGFPVVYIMEMDLKLD